jgi:hypothetical protein
VVAALKQAHAALALQQVDLLDDRRSRDKQVLRRFSKAAFFRHFQKGIQLMIVHIVPPA